MPLIETILSIKSLASFWPTLDHQDVVIVDVDDTLITPKDAIFRSHPDNPYAHFLDDLKAQAERGDADTREALMQKIGLWRLGRQVMHTEGVWASLLNTLQAQGTLVYALTKINSQPTGPIHDMPRWRAEELMRMGYTFTPTFQGRHRFEVPLASSDSTDPPVFHEGLFMTGSAPKEEVFDYLLSALEPRRHVLVFDDRRAILEAIGRRHAHRANLHLYHYNYVATLPFVPYEDRFKTQIQVLLEEGKWLGDEVFLDLEAKL